MKGLYALLINMKKDRKIRVGKLGLVNFQKGYYVYIGSAKNSIESRVKRHLSKEKKVFWHIDYLLQYATVKKAYYLRNTGIKECDIAKNFSNPVIGFGSSDSPCISHLFYFSRKSNAIRKIIKYFKGELKV